MSEERGCEQIDTTRLKRPMTRSKWGASIIALIVLLYVIFLNVHYLYWEWNDESTLVRNKIKNANVNNSVREFDFSNEVDKNIVRVCIQGKYMHKESFERYCGRTVDNFKTFNLLITPQSEVRLWLFYNDNPYKQILIFRDDLNNFSFGDKGSIRFIKVTRVSGLHS